MTVYIVQEAPGKNLVPAQKYGELELLLPARTNLMLSTGPEVQKLKRKLNSFSDEDYLLLIGDPAAIGLCCAIAASASGRFSVLKWDRQEMTYYPVTFDIRRTSTELGEVYV
tara:strand:+ start:268 stop:603 length:336 start_codon:yes stop_codon:yes gene_type:complete